MLTIKNVRYGNTEESCVVLVTDERGEVALDLSAVRPNHSEARQVFEAWYGAGGKIMAFVQPCTVAPADRVAFRLRNDPVLRGMVRFIANRFGLTSQQIIEEIRAAAN